MAQNVDPRTVAATNNRRKDSTKKVTEKRDNHNVTKRLQTELMQLMVSPPKGISAFPDGDNIFLWKATVEGSPDSMYEGLHYKLSMAFPSDYSVSAPKVKFLTPCFHPNVDTEGNICLDILKEEWVPTYTVSSILLSIQGLLAAPNIKSPLNLQAAQLWENPAAFRKTLHEKYKADSKRKGQGK
ncbi:probable ubiquitin-conjugating enzyme E2 C isoform X1 [Acanthaster planci]|uniref:Probable ubiquitin-conjugating enzyme E2 C isoform X1 n=1 Tax=Acanthaster planci TaxID=133434 RepID=A0A8B7YP87_ACAPL|nr:probable ubiquitin-conjugating enzyme E2 C isoform X1 [Acanthaster planci]